MAALTQNRNTFVAFVRDVQDYPVAAGAVIYQGGMVAIDAAGFAMAAEDTAGLSEVVGVSDQFIDNTGGANGARSVRVKKCVAKLLAGAGVTQALVGRPAFVEDDQTIQAAGNVGTGKVRKLEGSDVWVELGL